MVTRTDLTGARPLALVDAAIPVRQGSDARQEVFSRLNQIALGKFFQGDVLAHIESDTFLVRIADTDAKLNLPAGTKVGDRVPLTLVSQTPRPTFLLGPQAEAETTTLSDAGRLIGSVIQLAQQQGSSTTILGKTPLLSVAPLAATPLVATQVAPVLQDAIDSSGVFYESHLQQWVEGDHSLSALLREPQAQSPEAMRPLADALPALARVASQIQAAVGSGKSLPVLLQSPQFQTALASLMQDIEPAQPILTRILAQLAGVPGLSPAMAAADQLVPLALAGQVAPGALPASPQTGQGSSSSAPASGSPASNLTATGLPDSRLPAGATLPPAARAVADLALAHPALSNLLLQLGAPANAGKPAAELLQRPDILALVQQVADETRSVNSDSGRPPSSANNAASAVPQHGKNPEAEVAASPSRLIDGMAKTDADVLTQHIKATAGLTPDAVQIINQQLHALETRQLTWSGELWPGQKMDWEIKEETARPQHSQEQEKIWYSTVHFDLPHLGKVSANIRLTGGHLSMQIAAKDDSVVQMLRLNGTQLSDALATAGATLDTLLVKRDGQA